MYKALDIWKGYYRVKNSISMKDILRPSTLRRFNFLNTGLMCELYFTTGNYTHCTCLHFFKRPILNPHANMEYCRCGMIKELYSMRNMCVGKKFYKRHILLSVLIIVFDIFCMWGFQLRCSSIVNHKKSNSMTFSILSELIFISGTKCSMFL